MRFKIKSFLLLASVITSMTPLAVLSVENPHPLMASKITIANALGWVESNDNNCGGYYLEQAFHYPAQGKALIHITSHEGFFSKLSTSTLAGKVTVFREGQELTANKAYIYRNPKTLKLDSIDLLGNVHLREPNTLVVADTGHYVFNSNERVLKNIYYRTHLITKTMPHPGPIDTNTFSKVHKVTGLTVNGRATQFKQNAPRVYELTTGSFSTCPPINPAWHLQASKIILNENTGRGYATHARLYVKNMPILYFPYINFSIDGQRKTGFLWPTIGVSNNNGPYFLAPFYWNMAPNYDMTLTPGLLFKRGIQLSDSFRYLTASTRGKLDVSVIPKDQEFRRFQHNNAANLDYVNSTNPVIQSELQRLLSANDTRAAVFWRNDSRFNANWSTHVDFSYAGDDYYLEDFSTNLNQITQNYLLQEADLNFQSQHWNFLGRLQAYQTLHPIDQPLVLNQYRRMPQLMVSGIYPNQRLGLSYFVTSEATHFDFINTPGLSTPMPVGNRFHVQPGISLPLNGSMLYVNPRVQVALTQYQLIQNTATSTPGTIQRAVPIFDVAAGALLSRDLNFLKQTYHQTLEPLVYYVYIPFKDQADIPIFDTTVNTLTYDQIFNYNRFTGIDRIGDANQIGVGISSRFFDAETGFERIRVGVGQIIYFANRNVTLCNSAAICSDNPDNHSNYQRLSPLSGNLTFNAIPYWGASMNAIWNPITKQLDNTTIGIGYKSDEDHLVNLSYSFARGGDVLSGISTTDSSNNLKVTDLSAVWPITAQVKALARWSQNWNHAHLQNLIYGLQYDTCCWAVRFVGGRAFMGFDAANSNRPTYNKQVYLQFTLKGVGNIGNSDPTSLLSSINGYNPLFGQDT